MTYLTDHGSFVSHEQIDAFMAEFGIVLTRYPEIPITTVPFLDFLAESKLPPRIIELCRNYIDSGANLYNPADRPHPRSHVWPANLADLKDELFWAQPHKFIDRNTPIASMGSCFAVEIAYWLQENGFHYIISESVREDKVQKASARWGLVYSSANVKQVIEWAFGIDEPPLVVAPFGDSLPHMKVRQGVWTDLFRCDLVYDENEVKEAGEKWAAHLRHSRSALMACEVLVITVGLNEVFRWLPTGHYTHRAPTRINPALWQHEELTVQQNVDFLSSAIATLREYNPRVKIIATVSPVPLLKTFRRDTHVVSATAYSKSVLRVALEELARTVSDFYYMASYETVMYPGAGMPVWQEDARHVDPETVAKVMRLFKTQFCKDEV